MSDAGPRRGCEEVTVTNRRVMPGGLARAVREGRVTEVDVRPDLRAGREPFTPIMSAVEALPAGGVLLLRAIFEPAPLYRVLGGRGFDHWTERLADDDWRVWFYRRPAAPAEAGGEAAASCPACETKAAGEEVVLLDVRGLEPPEPMVRTLEALERLPEQACLVQINERVPRLLLPMLAERGFAWEIVGETPGPVRVFIRRAGAPPGPALAARLAGAAQPLPELDVRAIPLPEKHPAIFRTFDALAPGEAFVLVNDHDPRPLRHQLEATRGGAFEWEYLSAGPVEWRVRIGRARGAA